MAAACRCAALTLTLIWIAPIHADSFEFYPGANYDPAIPTLEKVVGHGWGEIVTMHHEAERYIHALDSATERVKVVRYGETWEGRPLYYLIVTSESHMAAVESIKRKMQQLADPRKLPAAEADALIRELPAITWLSSGVHGNEISSTDAALLCAYHLVAAQNDTLCEKILSNTVVIIDPMQNPDGRDRYLSYLRQTQSRWPDENSQAAEHNELWPSGRMNHYLFDMNRDWFANTQVETRGRTRIFLEWYPQVFADLHEMGYNQTYYFAPPAQPHNPNMTPSQIEWLTRFGRNNARWFDRFRFDYFTREIFDSFYPGYGEGWPIFQGAIGMTYEQAGVDGMVIRRDDESLLRYRDAVHHHFISSLATAEMAANNREAMLRYFYEYRRTAIDEGGKEQVKEYLLPPGEDPSRTAKLAALLMQQGIEVQQAEGPFTASRVRSYFEAHLQSRSFPAGTYIVSLAQPAKRLLKTLMDRHTGMEDKFIQEQIQRRQKRLNDEIYDVTAWSLPLIYGAECYAAEQRAKVSARVLTEAPQPQGKILGGKAHLAYLIPWGRNSSARALAALLRQSIRVYTTDKELTHNNAKFPRGSLIVKVKDNPADLFDTLTGIASEHGIDIHAANDSWVAEGVNFGSDHLHFIRRPKVALAYNLPTDPYSAGWTRYVLEQMYEYPVTAINAWQLESVALQSFNVLILPNGTSYFAGGYSRVLQEGIVQHLKHWLENGGTLITFGDATRWLTEEKVKLLSTCRELRNGKPECTPKEKENGGKSTATEPSGPYDLQQGIQPESELPDPTPGALMRVQLESTHWMSAGYGDYATVLVEGRNIFTPLKLDKGVNLAVYLPEDKVLVSGFTWDASRKQIANKAYLMYQRLGKGQIIAFAEDPNYRAFMEGLNLLFMNAVLLGPAH